MLSWRISKDVRLENLRCSVEWLTEGVSTPLPPPHEALMRQGVKKSADAVVDDDEFAGLHLSSTALN
jgi:hypothetical protein